MPDERRWAEHWQVSEEARPGGTSTVIKVGSRDGRIGALKQLMEPLDKSRERRFRMQREVNALKAVAQGVPEVFDSNADQWETSEPLFLVTEWIEGPNLAQAVSSKGIGIDAALALTEALLLTLERMRRLDIVHRDIKPDNMVLRDGDPRHPILLDFGQAWAKPVAEGKLEFESGPGQEMGNRFLRLPENAPGRSSRDHRSDLTMIVAVLFYAVTGLAPRALRDERDHSPEVALLERIPKAVRDEPRWPKLRRVFLQGFQTDLALRFQEIEELRMLLSNLDPAPQPESDPVAIELAKLQERLASKETEALALANTAARQVGEECFAALSKAASRAGFATPGSHGFKGDGDAARYAVQCGLQRADSSILRWAIVNIYVDRNGFRIWTSAETDPAAPIPFHPLYDTEGLRERVLRLVPTVLAKAISDYTAAIDSQLGS